MLYIVYFVFKIRIVIPSSVFNTCFGAIYNKEMAELLSNQYASVFSTPRDESHSEYEAEDEAEPNPAKLSDIEFDKADIEAAIDELSSNAAAGIDGFPAILLKKCKEALSYPLYMFWRKCLD